MLSPRRFAQNGRLAQRAFRYALPAMALAAALAGCGKKSSVDPKVTAQLVAPVAKVVLKAQTVAPGSRRSRAQTGGALPEPMSQ